MEILTNHETARAEEPMHGIQSPFDNFLKVRSHLANQKVERPVGLNGIEGQGILGEREASH